MTDCGGEGNENWPSNHACQVVWGQSVPINTHEDWRHSAPCVIKPKMKAAFLIKIALPAFFPKGILICKNLLSLEVVSNWALLNSLPIISWERETCMHTSWELQDASKAAHGYFLCPHHLLFLRKVLFGPVWSREMWVFGHSKKWGKRQASFPTPGWPQWYPHEGGHAVSGGNTG